MSSKVKGCVDLPNRRAQETAPDALITPSRVVRLWHQPDFDTLTEATDFPFVKVYLPTKNPTRTGVLIFPGGGYRYLALEHEGTQVAEWLVDRGIAAFLVHYRVNSYDSPVPLLDGVRAMRTVRSRAAEFGISPDRIGVWGFSAGGHVASTLMTSSDSGSAKVGMDEIDQVSERPDFGILAYPVISMDPSIAHAGSREMLLGANPTCAIEERYSNELHVKTNSPPAFLFATSNDPVVPVANSVRFYCAYIERQRSVEMHIFEHGPHGVGLAKEQPALKQWPNLLEQWMRLHSWIAF